MDLEAIIFDLGGTLVEYAGPYAVWPDLETPGLKAAYQVLTAKGVLLPAFDEFSSAGFHILPLRWQMATNGERNLRLTDFLSEIMSQLHIAGIEDEWLLQAASRYEEAICAQAVPLTAAADTLAILKEQGYRLGLLSNTMFSGSAHQADLVRFGLDSYFDAMLFSADTGTWKPSPKPYLALVEQLATTPEKTVFVGDDPANDIVGGQKAGLSTILLRSNSRFHLPDDIKPDALIAHLSELPDLLASWSDE
jgi:putative hydrolase of the HAD superfamily